MFRKCVCCKNSSHTIAHCPKMHFVKPRDAILVKYLYCEEQEREYAERK